VSLPFLFARTQERKELTTMTANLKIGPCPKCGNTTFITTAHVTQTWLVDEDGDFIEAKSDCDEVTHAPDAEDLFTCSKCGAEVPAKYAYNE
jgi:predicted RNA-binding Zn-ribbon protein involved in translation (DUF1610 family)